MSFENNKMHGTTILCIKKDNDVVIACDGQISLGNQIIKHNANKIRILAEGKIVLGFAGSAADGITLYERFENKLKSFGNENIMRAAIELSKDWRTDKFLRKLEAMMIVANQDHILVLSGNGDVIEVNNGATSIGSGGLFALSAARALLSFDNKLSAKEIVQKSMKIAADTCVFSNLNVTIHEVNK